MMMPNWRTAVGDGSSDGSWTDTVSRYPAHHRHPNGKETAEICKRGAGNGLVNVFTDPSLPRGQPVTRRGRPHWLPHAL